MKMEQWWNDTDREKPETRAETFPHFHFSPPSFSHGMVWDRTQVSAVTDRRLTAWGMARPEKYEIYVNFTQNFSSYLTVECE